MLLTSFDPLIQDFERQFARLARQMTADASVMPMDAVRREDDVVLRFDLPGMDPDSIDVTLDRDTLTVSARREESYGDGERAFVRERMMGTFTRRVQLGEHLDVDAIEAAYDNGVLAIRIPVKEAAKPRQIKIARANGTKALTR